MRSFSDDLTGGAQFERIAKPSFNMMHIDGPVITFSDGQMHWLTWRERIAVRLGWETAHSLQIKLRPKLTVMLHGAKMLHSQQTW